jgi:hypothetical protein
MRGDLAFAMVFTLGLVSGCGGAPVCCVGGPGAGGSGVASFSAFSETKPGETVRATALSTTSSSPQPSDGTVDLTLDETGVPTALDIVTGSARAGWSGDEISCSGSRCSMNNGEDVATFVNPAAPGWNYQTFGYWIHEPAAASTATTAVSMGNPTPGSAVIGQSTASYTGTSGGTYTVGSTVYEHSARMTAAVDFGSRVIVFRTTDTALGLSGSPMSFSAPSLNMTGTLTFGDGYRFSGPVHTAGFFGIGQLDGTAAGSFYGPQAEEIGGVYALDSPIAGGVTLTGGFGGKHEGSLMR